jgi:RNA polymerase sigma factor (sigma-70 family)
MSRLVLSSSDRMLLEAASLGDEAAFEGIYHRYRQIVYAFASESVDDVDTAESVVQDTFLTLWRKLPEMGTSLRDIRAWLLVTADNFVQNSRRRSGRRASSLNIADYENLAVEPDQAATLELLRRIGDEVRGMPSVDLAIFTALIVDGRSYDEVALAVGLNLGAVKMRMRRIRLRLRLALPRGMW